MNTLSKVMLGLIDSSEDDHYIRIQGLKLEDTTVKHTATFYGGGKDCQSFFSAFDGKKRQVVKASTNPRKG